MRRGAKAVLALWLAGSSAAPALGAAGNARPREDGRAAADAFERAVAQGRWKDAEASRARLIQAARAELAWDRLHAAKDPALRREWVAVLARISSPGATAALRQVVFAAGSGEERWPALVELSRRRAALDLSDEEAAWLARAVQGGDEIRAGAAARVLCAGRLVPVAARVAPVAERIAQAVAGPARPRRESYLTDRGALMAGLLSALEAAGPEALAPLAEAARKTYSGGRADAAAWLTVARGTLGDKAVAGELRAIATGAGRDPELRHFAVRALPAALGEEARPLLKSLLSDAAEVPGGDVGGPARIVRIAAQQALQVLDARRVP